MPDNPLNMNMHRSDEEISAAALRDEEAFEWLYSLPLDADTIMRVSLATPGSVAFQKSLASEITHGAA